MNEPSELKHKRRILIVEDEPIVAMSLELLLECEGFEIAGIAETVQEAMAMIAERSFDAVVLDINLQGRFSCEVGAALQRLSIPFVVVSGYDPDQQRATFSQKYALSAKALSAQRAYRSASNAGAIARGSSRSSGAVTSHTQPDRGNSSLTSPWSDRVTMVTVTV